MIRSAKCDAVANTNAQWPLFLNISKLKECVHQINWFHMVSVIAQWIWMETHRYFYTAVYNITRILQHTAGPYTMRVIWKHGSLQQNV